MRSRERSGRERDAAAPHGLSFFMEPDHQRSKRPSTTRLRFALVIFFLVSLEEMTTTTPTSPPSSSTGDDDLGRLLLVTVDYEWLSTMAGVAKTKLLEAFLDVIMTAEKKGSELLPDELDDGRTTTLLVLCVADDATSEKRSWLLEAFPRYAQRLRLVKREDLRAALEEEDAGGRSPQASSPVAACRCCCSSLPSCCTWSCGCCSGARSKRKRLRSSPLDGSEPFELRSLGLRRRPLNVTVVSEEKHAMAWSGFFSPASVSYTHLTLPTIYSV